MATPNGPETVDEVIAASAQEVTARHGFDTISAGAVRRDPRERGHHCRRRLCIRTHTRR